MEIFRLTIYILYWIIVFVCVLTILHKRLDPTRSLSWIVVLIMLPVGGIILFLCFGQNFRRKWINFRRGAREYEFIDKYYRKQLNEIAGLTSGSSIGNDRQMITLLLNNSRAFLTSNNNVEILHNGKETFGAIMEAIGNARESIHIEYYILEADSVGMSLIELLEKKAREGVKVRILYDQVGSWKLKSKIIKRIKRSGIEIKCFFPVIFTLLSSRMNNRNHRKIVVVDGCVGFTGGINIAERYLSEKWYDTHLRITGDSVRLLQLTFLSDWHYATKEVVKDWKKYFSQSTELVGKTAMQIVVSGPDMPWESIMQAYFEAITKARESIYISTPYFMPTQPILTAIKVAALGGIDVRIMMPRHSDFRPADYASRSYFSELIDAGVKIYLFNDGIIHTKMLCVDDHICSIGSVNMDQRSLEDNYEVTAIMYDREIVEESKSRFLEGCDRCHLLTQSRHGSHAFLEAICRLVSPIL